MIPSFRPRLPTLEMLAPYLKRIDEARYYTNFGPLVLELQQRIAGLIGSGENSIITTSNGTTSLENAIQAYGFEKGQYAVLPAWTFSATAHAVLNAGLKPFFTDVDADSWAMTPEIARAAIKKCPGPVALAMPVAPFGMPLPVEAWEEFRSKTNVEVLIDAAAVTPTTVQASESVTISVSLHTTKMLGAGEGGLIIRKDPAFIEEVKNHTNFGLFGGPRGIDIRGGNAKMSEYHAAVALASLDEREAIIADFMRVAKRYRKNLGKIAGVHLRPGYGETYCTSLTVIETEKEFDDAWLIARGIGARPPWRRGCHSEPLFANVPRTDLPVTEHIKTRYSAIPCYRDLPDEQIDFICEQLKDVLNGA